MALPIEEAYQDILQNIESAVVGVYHQHSELTDFQVESAMEALGRTYVRNSPILPKNDLAKEVYTAMKAICDWRLGRENMVDEDEQPMSVEAVSTDVILACLKKLRKSVSYWNKESGTRGYLGYISQFVG